MIGEEYIKGFLDLYRTKDSEILVCACGWPMLTTGFSGDETSKNLTCPCGNKYNLEKLERI